MSSKRYHKSTMDNAKFCYENRPCNWHMTKQTLREFAHTCADLNDVKPTPALIDALIDVINENE